MVLYIVCRGECNVFIEFVVLLFDIYEADVCLQVGGEVGVLVVVEFIGDVGEVVFVVDCFVYVQGIGVEEVVFQVGGVFYVEVVKGLILYNGFVEVYIGLIVLKVIFYWVIGKIVLCKV